PLPPPQAERHNVPTPAADASSHARAFTLNLPENPIVAAFYRLPLYSCLIQACGQLVRWQPAP
ncbi:hypothetical protein, partial [Sphingomonas sp. GC_Shp_4]|uniref:hypothetical protein n=1 Tax=Sphingomonas sp. GC_Shp_4 TaxID=2937382 RepID=UPI00226B9F98